MAQGTTKSSQADSNVQVDVNLNTPDLTRAISQVFGEQHLDDIDSRLKTRDARYESQITTGYLRKANDAITVLTAGFSQVSVQLSGQWVGQLVFEATLDNTTWFPLVGMAVTPILPTGSTQNISFAVNPGIYKFCISALRLFRVRSTVELPKATVSVSILLSAGPAAFDISAEVIATSQNMPIQQEPASGHLQVVDFYLRNTLDSVLVEQLTMNDLLRQLLLEMETFMSKVMSPAGWSLGTAVSSPNPTPAPNAS